MTYPIIIGVAIAATWANIAPLTYEQLLHADLFHIGHHVVTPHAVVNELLMALFFLVAAKEVREQRLIGGSLHDNRQAALPILAVIGGVAVPAAMYLGLASVLAPHASSGWLIPTATDIAFASSVAIAVFGSRTSAPVTFLLTIAIVDDAIGLALIPSVYAEGVHWPLLILAVAYGVGAPFVLRERLRVKHFGWYLAVVGAPTWVAFYLLGVEPAMALVPMVVGMPHADKDEGYMQASEHEKGDALNQMEHAIAPLLGPILFLFGLANAGISFGGIGRVTWIVLFALAVGKLVGITLFTYIGITCGLRLPDGMRARDVPVIGLIAGIGFTVSLFVAGVAFAGKVAAAAKMGAFLSLPVISATGFLVARVLRVGRFSA